ncbi:MAG: hypothetical protein HYZ28_15415 [Myxococcales bacterium]|nr:hypothetical protein [Myxococcales bacterium]
MRSRSVAVGVVATVLLAGGAVFCHLRGSQLRSEGEWHMARGNAAAREYAATLDGASAESELAAFEQRRAVLERSHHWKRLELICILATVLSAFASYLLRLIARVRREVAEADAALEQAGRN